MTTKEIIEKLKKQVYRDYGKRCKKHYYSCFVCEIYEALDILTDAYYEKIHIL